VLSKASPYPVCWLSAIEKTKNFRYDLIFPNIFCVFHLSVLILPPCCRKSGSSATFGNFEIKKDPPEAPPAGQDILAALCQNLPAVAIMSHSCQTGNGHPLASLRLQALLAMEKQKEKDRQTWNQLRIEETDPADGKRKSLLGRSSHPWRVAQTGI
jgi:hypothetical protein